MGDVDEVLYDYKESHFISNVISDKSHLRSRCSSLCPFLPLAVVKREEHTTNP